MNSYSKIVGLIVSVTVGAAVAVPRAQAACNLIPGTEITFDGAIGATNRPFAGPGEPLEIRVRPCDSASTEPMGFVAPASNYIVTAVFQARAGADRAVILSTNCAFYDAMTDTTCEAQLGGGSADCITVSSPQDLDVVSRTEGQRLSVRFPDTDDLLLPADDDRTFAGPTSIAVTQVGDALPCHLATQSCRSQSGLVACVDDFFANDGTCQTRVPATTFASFTALPVPNDYGRCFSTIPPCDPQSPDEFRLTTDKAGNVLAPVDWREVLVQQAQVPVPRLLRATLGPPAISVVIPGESFVTSHTPEGGLLPPIFEPQFDARAPSGVATLFGSADAPYTVLRVARRSETFQECLGGAQHGQPCNEAADCPGACAGPPNAGARCTDDADCTPSACGAPGVCGATVCNPFSANALSPCNSDRNCQGGECGPALFDVDGLAYASIGPIVVDRFGTSGVCQEETYDTCSLLNPCGSGSCVQYTLEAQNPVPLEGLEQSSGISAFSVDEGIDGVIRNGDGDTDDTVLTLRDRDTGIRQPLGAPVGCAGIMGTPEGRAVVRVFESPFSFPAVASEGNVVAFLESETDTDLCNENGDDDVDDTILRVFQPNPVGSTATELTAGISPPIAADAALVINDRSLAISDGHVFFRANEAAAAGKTTRAISRDPSLNIGDGSSQDATISFDGRYVAFSSFATNLLGLGGDTNNNCQVDGNPGGVLPCSDIYVFDRHTDSMERASVTTNEDEATYGSFDAMISGNGRYVAFRSDALNIASTLLFEAVRDRVATTTTRVDVSSAENPATDASTGFPTISSTGRYIGFTSRALNLAPFSTDENGVGSDAYSRDQFNGITTVESYAPDGMTLSNGFGVFPRQPVPISDDGRWSAFLAQSTNLVVGAFGIPVYLRDRLNGVTIVASRGSLGPVSARWPSMSDDGRFVSYHTNANTVIANDLNNFCDIDGYLPGASSCTDVFVYDREHGVSEIVSVANDGTQGDGPSDLAMLSADGRYVAFRSAATNLVPDDMNGVTDIFVRDRLTHITTRVSVDDAETEGDQHSGYLLADPGVAGAHVGTVSADGSVVSFTSFATNLDTGDSNASSDVFVREPDPADVATADITGDGRADDTVLQTLDTATTDVIRLCPSAAVSVVAGTAAFLRPEGAGAAPDLETPAAGIAGCPVGSVVSGGISLNMDTDPDDDVVHFWPGNGQVDNLDIAATGIAMSGRCDGGENQGRSCTISEECPEASCVPMWIAALASEADHNQTDLNGDQDEEDDVVEVYNIGATTWTNVGQAADELLAIGNLTVFLTPEASQNDDLNNDDDTGDRVVQIYDALAARLTNLRRAAEEIVVGRDTDACTAGPLVAFRTSEAAQDNASLNGDNDPDDDVLHVWSADTGLINTGQAVIPCRLEACDPRHPYRVLGSRVKFLTFECDQGGVVTAGCPAGGTDLNGDGDSHDLILQQFDACTREIDLLGEVDDDAGSSGDPLAPPEQGSGDVFVTKAGRCYQGMTQLLVPASCLNASECPSGATCEEAAVVATKADVSAHDVVLLARKALTVKMRSPNVSTSVLLKLKLRNADVTGEPVRLRLTATDGTCPAGTVTGLPDVDSRTDGVQDTVLVAPRKSVKAVVPITISAAAFTTHSALAPARCTLELDASVVAAENVDPTPRNNLLEVELNVIDGNDAPSVSTHESVLVSLKPVKIKIGHDPAADKTIKVQIANVDIGEPDHDIMVSATDGDCPPGTVGSIVPVTSIVPGEEKPKVAVTLNVSKDDFTSPSKYAPARCTAQITATTDEMGNVEPDASNNSSTLVIDVIDGNDF